MIWVIGGTSDATTIVNLLQQKRYDILVSTTTDYGTQRISDLGVKIEQRKLEIADMQELIINNKISTVVDASHPYAEVVSTNAITACNNQNIKYIRYEREQNKYNKAHYYSSYEEMVGKLSTTQGNILLTIGSKNVHMFQSLKDRIIARVLPVEYSIRQCKEAGLQAHQIIATKGRVSKITNMALMQEYNIMHMVTKDSGEAGGMKEKIDAANDLVIETHILDRPKVDYPLFFNEYAEILKAVELDQ